MKIDSGYVPKPYKERVEEGVGKYLVYNGTTNEDSAGNYISNMTNCHFRGLNTGNNTFTLVETDTKGAYTFHMEKVFASDISVGVALGTLLSKDWNIKAKYCAIKTFYRIWHFKG